MSLATFRHMQCVGKALRNVCALVDLWLEQESPNIAYALPLSA